MGGAHLHGRDRDPSVLARVALLLVAFAFVLVAALLAAGDGSASPGHTAGASAALTGCPEVGPYRTPEPGTAGLPVGLKLCPSGSLTISVPGAVLDGWDVRGGIVVDAPDVVVRRTRVTGDSSAPFGISTNGAGSVRIEDTTLTGDFPEAAVGGERWSGERLEITGVTGDGLRLGDGSRLRRSTVHDFATRPGGESRAVVLAGRVGDMLVEENRVEVGKGPGRVSAVVLAPTGSGSRAEIRDNVLGGGRYTVHQTSTLSADVRVTGNRFLRDAEQGPLRVSSRAVVTDNSYVGGGALPER